MEKPWGNLALLSAGGGALPQDWGEEGWGQVFCISNFIRLASIVLMEQILTSAKDMNLLLECQQQ